MLRTSANRNPLPEPTTSPDLIATQVWLRPSPATLGITCASAVLLSFARAVSGMSAQRCRAKMDVDAGKSVRYIAPCPLRHDLTDVERRQIRVERAESAQPKVRPMIINERQCGTNGSGCVDNSKTAMHSSALCRHDGNDRSEVSSATPLRID